MAQYVKDKEWIAAQVKAYVNLLPRYRSFESVLKAILSAVKEEYAPLAIIQTRVTTIPSFTGKILRKRLRHKSPVHDFTDLCGARIIVQSRDFMDPVCNFIKANFEIDWEISHDVSQRLKENEFGYRSIHYIVSMKPGKFPSREMDIVIPPEVYPDDITPMKAEIQVRTMLEHCWAECSHDIEYKCSFNLPRSIKRELAAAAAFLEKTDHSLVDINSTIDVAR